jgi:SAM-dependent methyltransferase
MSFVAFVLARLPPGRARVIEIGCGPEGGVVDALVRAGHDVVGVDPDAPEGGRFRRVEFEDLEEGGTFDAAVASRVLHHVRALGPVLDKIARLAPLLVVEEFAWERIDPPTQEWYETHRRSLAARGMDPRGPAELDEWRKRHPDLHPASTVLRELETRFEERFLEERPYFYRWLHDPGTQAVEAALIASRAIQPIGLRYVGVRR